MPCLIIIKEFPTCFDGCPSTKIYLLAFHLPDFHRRTNTHHLLSLSCSVQLKGFPGYYPDRLRTFNHRHSAVWTFLFKGTYLPPQKGKTENWETSHVLYHEFLNFGLKC